MTDQLTHLLDQIDQLDKQATKGPWKPHYGGNPHDEWLSVEPETGTRTVCTVTDDHQQNAEFIALSRTALPTLAQTVRAVLELHEPIDDHIHLRAKICSHRYCVDEALDQMEYPCPTVQAITDALGGH